MPAIAALILALLPGWACDAGRHDRDDRPDPGAYSYLEAAVDVRPGVLLARPAPEGAEETNSTLRVLLELIRHTPSGERIRIVGNSFSLVPVADALVAAHDRGVRVQVIVSRGVSAGWKAPALLEEALGIRRGRSSWLYLSRSQVHQKTWSFTRTGQWRDVTVVGSMNLTYVSARQYTDMRMYADRPDVMSVFDQRFEQLVRELPHPTSVVDAPLGPDRVWFYPGYDLASDPVARALGGLPAADLQIKVAMYAWLDERGEALARTLVAYHRGGAAVDVVLGRSVGPRIRAVLTEGGVPIHRGVFADGEDIHLKLTVVRYRASDGGWRRFVLTGSDNYTSRSLDRPEVLLRLAGEDATGRRIWRRYDGFVDALIARGDREARSE